MKSKIKTALLSAAAAAAGIIVFVVGRPPSMLPPSNTGAPSISGVDQVSVGTLTAFDGTWNGNPTSFTYQWQRADNLAFTTNVTNIGTNSTYALTVADNAKYHRVTVTAINVSGSTPANSTVIGPTANAATSLANLWVSPGAGSSTCTRSTTQITFTAAGGAPNAVCDTADRAYHAAAAAGGDVVRYPCGTFSQVMVFTADTTKTGMTVFTPDTSLCTTLDPTVGGTASTAIAAVTLGSGFTNGTNWITVKDFNLVSYNSAVIENNSTSQQHITIDGNNINVGVKCWCGNTISIRGPARYWNIINNTIGPQCCASHNSALSLTASPVGVNIGKANTSTPSTCANTACDIHVDGNFFQFASMRNCSEWPSSGFGLCPDTNCSNNTYCHYDGVHWWGCITCSFNFNKFYGQACQGIFAENGVNSGIGRDIEMIGNTSSSISSLCNGFLSLKMNNTSEGTWKICYNEGPNSIAPIYGLGSLAPPVGTTIILCGNYAGMFEQTQSPNCAVLPCGSPPLGCTLTGGGGGTYTCAPRGAGCGTGAVNISIIHKYNISRTSGQGPCDSTDAVATTPSWVNSSAGPAVGQDMRKTGANGTADNFIVCSAMPVPCPSTDVFGLPRPQNTNADGGAAERNS